MHSELGTSVPAFLAKLWKLVEDPETDNLISWSSSGLSFYIRDQARFARELLPLYYKHNNMASFVRQLNMYGFHKVVSVDSGGLKLDKDEMEFAHTYFLKGHEYLLEHIKRKIPVSKQEETRLKPEIMTRVFTDVRLIKGKQDTMDSRLAAMKRENEALWREVASLRQKHMKQQQIVNKLIQFLVSIVQPNNRGLGTKRRYPLMIDDINGASTSKSSKPKETTTSPTLPRKKVTSLNTNLKKDASSKDINLPALNSISSGGPIIHDVTDLSDGDDEALVEGDVGFPPEANIETVLRTEFLDQDDVNSVSDPSVPTSDFGHVNENKDLSDLLENNDGSLLAKELLAGANTSGLTASEERPTAPEPMSSSVDMDPLSPELLLTVDPTALNVSSPAPSTSALDELDFDAITDGFLGTPPTAGAGGKGKAKKVATETIDKQGGKHKDMRVALLDSGASSANTPVGRHELDTHLDTMQVELDNLRELLSLQGCNVDATTLLGVGDDAPFSYETDSLRPVSTPALPNSGGFNLPQWAGMVQANQMPFHPAMFDHGTLRKLFNGEEPMNPVSHYLSDMDGKGNGAITGSELIAYTPSFFELTTGDENMFSSGPLSPSDMTSDPLPTGNVDVEAEDDDEDNALNALLAQPAPKKKLKKN